MYNRFFKRILDIICSLFFIPVFLVLLLFVSIAILFDDHGPIFYCAPRVGHKEKVFKMVKFRTMAVNAPDLRNADGSTFNEQNDFRLTRVGKFLREFSLDEIPQIINVFIGDMSFIGPRPDLLDALMIFDSHQKQKYNVLPGISGYNQAFFRNSVQLSQRVENDIFYANNISFGLDVKILFQTIKSILFKSNIYCSTDENSTNVHIEDEKTVGVK